MTVDDLIKACVKVDEYYQGRPDLKTKTIAFYWYGGEPTQMGQAYFLEAFSRIQEIFSEEKGYYIRHDILTSLLNIEDSWFDIFKTWGRGHFQTSFDGLMRGKGYMKKWDKRVRQAVSEGLAVSTISVVNHELVSDGPKGVLDYLIDLGVVESSFLPFMLNEQNAPESYEKFAPPMTAYSDFMIELTEYWYELKAKGVAVPYIGQMTYIIDRQGRPSKANIAGQTMFLLPDGDFVLPDYRDGFLEFMKPFGNIFESTFKEVINSRSRRDYIRRQYTRNYNSECVNCDHQNHCIMEFWKENRKGDDCFGAKKYVEWLIKEEAIQGALVGEKSLMF
jgi:sulfatase maturation enzyme AslB (radical SAM superfamily)